MVQDDQVPGGGCEDGEGCWDCMPVPIYLREGRSLGPDDGDVYWSYHPWLICFVPDSLVKIIKALLINL